MLREQFLDILSSVDIGRKLVIITLADGARHIVHRHLIDTEDPCGVEYVEVHAISTGYYMWAPYESIVGVEGCSPRPTSAGMSRHMFVEEMRRISARATGDNHRILITLTDGGVHLIPTATVMFEGTDRATYGEVHLKVGFWMMSVPYNLVCGISPYRALTLVSD